jgi:pyruvate dehydrogenase E1 component beta subunit
MELTYREALREALREEMERDQSVILMGEEVGPFGGSYKVSQGLYEQFGENRIIDTPIAEEGIIGAGIGAAMTGLRPVCEIMTINFLLVGIDQLVNNAAKIPYMFNGQARVPLVVRTPSGAGHQLSCQHSQVLEVWCAYVPGMYVLAPGTPADAKGMLKTAIRDDNPILFVENVLLYNEKGEVPEGEHLVPVGQAAVMREGEDVSMITYSRMVGVTLHAAEELAKDGIEAEVVDLRSLRPLDIDTVITSVRKTNRAIFIEEGWRSYGIGAEIAAQIQELAFDDLDHPVERIAGKEVPLPYATDLERAATPSIDMIVETVKRMVKRRQLVGAGSR